MSRSRYGRRALRAYSDALDLAHRDTGAPQPACRWRPEEFVDYADDAIPSEVEAAGLCGGCPLLELCLENARRTKPGWGVLGGIAWVYGRQWHLVADEDKASIINPENA